VFASSSRGAQTSNLSSDTIAADIAAFKHHGGRIEVLGTTPLRTQAQGPAFRSKTTAKRASAAVTPVATKKSAG
jgi:S-adenosylmethionine:tRNA-ribosyltransferase-isomerase (queuine synthetase)